MKIALCQINTTVLDFKGNKEKIINSIKRVHKDGANFAVFPELCITGYPPKDYLEYDHIIEKSNNVAQDIHNEVLKLSGDFTAIIGMPTKAPSGKGEDYEIANTTTKTGTKPLYNSAVVLNNKCKYPDTVHKRLLPDNDEFNESRYFTPYNPHESVVPLQTANGMNYGVLVCHDAWNDVTFWDDKILYYAGPVYKTMMNKPKVIFVINASPYTKTKPAFREKMFSLLAKRHNVAFVYVNQVGGNDGLVFDGNSFVMGKHGATLMRCEGFKEDEAIFEMGEWHKALPLYQDNETVQLRNIRKALVLGLKDYMRKTAGFTKVIVGNSGGIDSAVTLALCAEAIGPKNVISVSMPSTYSSDGSIRDAEQLAKNLGIKNHHLIPINAVHNEFNKNIRDRFAYRNHAQIAPNNIADENIQARIRGNILMWLSNAMNGALVVTTGNKSEVAVGYSTLYGDMCGGFNLLLDVSKMMVYDLAEDINTTHLEDSKPFSLVPVEIIKKEPSAELREGQVDQDSLPPYKILDKIIEMFIEDKLWADQIAEKTGYDLVLVKKVVSLIVKNEFKRQQAAPGVKVTSKAFSAFVRQMPIAAKVEM